MDPSSLNDCHTVGTFIKFVDSLDATIGKRGGRYFVARGTGEHYTMNQIVFQFKKIVTEKRPPREDILKGCEVIKKQEENELFEALLHGSTKTVSDVRRYLTKIRQVIGNFIFKITHSGFDRKAVLNTLKMGGPIKDLPPGYTTDPNRLIRTKEEVPPSHFSWMLHLGLLRVAEESATPEEKKKIRFLASNFLSKSAPIQLKCWKPFFRKVGGEFEKMFDKLYQVSPFDDYWYHRESSANPQSSESPLNRCLAYGKQTEFILTDTIEFTHLYPLQFTVINPNFSVAELIEIIKNPPSKPLLIDATDQFKETIYTGADKKKEKEFKAAFESYKKQFNDALEEAASQAIAQDPSLKGKKKELLDKIKSDITCIARVQDDSSCGIKALPLVDHSEKKSHLSEFVNLTGLYLGAMSLRRGVLDAFSRHPDVYYDVQPNKKSDLQATVYPTKESFIQTDLLSRLSKKFEQETRPHIRVLGKSTLDLLHGVIQEIDQKKWEEIQKNSPALHQIVQASLVMIREHLAMSELHAASNNFAKFAQEIELIHAELATLLELFKPFDKDDFENIYKESLREVVNGDFRARLGKTAMNIFAGINHAAMQINPNVQRVYGSNIYFEQKTLGGGSHIDELKKDPNSPKVDLYVAQFNPNINVDPALEEYRCEDVIGNIRYLLDNNKAAKQLTVAVDTTIEKIPSPHVKELLAAFKDEIASGRLNFVIFGSGQKFDMLGMDNYYGAPFYVVNNGKEEWKSFERLFTDTVHETDSLSNQWFCLAYKYARDSLAAYKELIFSNTRYILENMPQSLRPRKDFEIKINRANRDMDVCFIDIKMKGKDFLSKSYKLMQDFYKAMQRAGVKLFSRQSFGFYHPCYLVFDLPLDLGASTTRLTPGINPEDNEAILTFFRSIEAK